MPDWFSRFDIYCKQKQNITKNPSDKRSKHDSVFFIFCRRLRFINKINFFQGLNTNITRTFSKIVLKISNILSKFWYSFYIYVKLSKEN